jgi:hypothetical protein
MTLLTNKIEIRGTTYEVSEIDGKTMREIRKRLKETDASRPQAESVETYLAWRCTVSPPFASEADAANAPHLVVKLISEEAFRLSTPEGEPKNA